MGYSPNMMNIDPERLRNFAAKNGGLKHISLQLGYSRSYLSNVADYGRMRLSVARQLSAMYGVPEDFFRAREPEKPKAAAPQAGQTGYALLLEHDGEKVGSAYSRRKDSSELALTQAISYAAHMIYKFCEQKTLQESMEGK